MVGVESVDPSSTTMSSIGRYVCRETESRVSDIKQARLKVGTITETSPGV
jgi:uncharacterized protein YlaI